MKRTIRTILSLVLVICLCASLCVSVFADPGEQHDNEFGNPTPDYSETTYRVIVAKELKGKVISSHTTATEGTLVTLTIEEGVTVLEISVLDQNDKAVKLTQVDESTYTFRMPASDVNVEGTVEDLRLNMTDHMAYIEGYPDGTFRPYGSLTRAEAATIFYRLLLDKTITKDISFSDVPSGAWYETAVKTLASKGVITGYPDGTFKPNGTVSRAEFCAMAARFFALKTTTLKYTDVPTDFWGYKYIASVVARGWMTDAEVAYKPNEAITRAEVVGIVNRMLERSADESYLKTAGEELKTFTDVAETDSFYLDVMEAANGHDYEKVKDDEIWTALK